MIKLSMLAMLAAGDEWMSSRMIGEAALISIGAILLGYVVSLIWPKGHHPVFFGALAAAALIAGLAYIGSQAATLAIMVLAAATVLAFFLGVM